MVSVMLYPCIFLSMDLFVLCVTCLTVFVNCLVKQFAIYGRGCYSVVECYGVVWVGGTALLDRPCMVLQRVCVLCL